MKDTLRHIYRLIFRKCTVDLLTSKADHLLFCIAPKPMANDPEEVINYVCFVLVGRFAIFSAGLLSLSDGLFLYE